MLVWQNLIVTFVAATLLVAADNATPVLIKGVHLCCTSCSDGAEAALEGLKGISKAGTDRKTKEITFQAATKADATEALNSLAKEGFYGTATFGKEELKWPDSGAKKGEKVSTIIIEDVHLCCGSCVKGAKEALAKLATGTEIDVDRKTEIITVKGKDLDEADAIAALNKGGFYGKIKRTEKK
jgi:copper chaperone CopZ